jgi:hypothetical protein
MQRWWGEVRDRLGWSSRGGRSNGGERVTERVVVQPGR